VKRPLVAYVSIVIAGGALFLAWSWHALPGVGWPHVVAWIVVGLAAERLWLRTITGRAMDSMASTVDMSLIVLLGAQPAAWIVAIYYTLANVIFARREWYRTLFNSGQNVLTVAAAGGVYAALGGRSLALEAGLAAGAFRPEFHDLWLLVPYLAAITVYFLVNTLLVSGAVALSAGRRLLDTWREEYLYSSSVVSSVALFSLAPLVVVSFLSIGYVCLPFFAVSVILIKEAQERYIALEKARDELIRSERLAAKGEMAAEVAHEINNYLAILSGRSQLLHMGASTLSPAQIQEATRIIFEQARNMSVLTKGLLDFSHKESKMQRTRLNDLARKTVEFVSPQNKYERVQFELDLSAEVSDLELDPGQIQQVLLNFFSNSADALNAGRVLHPRVVVRTRPRQGGREIELVVEDNGPGLPAEAMGRLFEPSFTTKPEGHGFGLSTCYRIVQNHGGRIVAENVPGSGARFIVTLPVAPAADAA
jgi:signal transduction histidine kinase